MRYYVSYLIVLVMPITAVAASFNTQFIADYRQSHIGRLHLSAEKTMSDLERQLSQMDLIAMHFSSFCSTMVMCIPMPSSAQAR